MKASRKVNKCITHLPTYLPLASLQSGSAIFLTTFLMACKKSYSKYPPGTTKEKLLAALPALGVFTEHQWTMPNIEDMALVTSVLHLNNISIFSAIMQLGKVTNQSHLLQALTLRVEYHYLVVQRLGISDWLSHVLSLLQKYQEMTLFSN